MLDGSLDDISKRFERSVLTRLYRTIPAPASWRRLAFPQHHRQQAARVWPEQPQRRREGEE
ncbi:hypothetical protein M8494_09200 [Serratia ureilytica]